MTMNFAFTIQAQNENASVEAVFTDEAGEYIVEKFYVTSRSFDYRLAIKRQDREPIRSWRVLQDIKNAVAGIDRTAIEVYPPESEVTDTANMYHLWVCALGYEPPVRLTKPLPDMEAYKGMMDGE